MAGHYSGKVPATPVCALWQTTHAVQRLRDPRLLSSVDGAGLMSAGEYAMTSLASAISEFYRRDDALTSESLTLLTKPRNGAGTRPTLAG
ncbi:MAG: hypothetical protein ACT4QB_16495 [Gammaproteobacteria bacterium]